VDKRVLWITRTAVFLALLIVAQLVTKPLGQFVTGSIVNLILIVSVMTCGLLSGLAVALISPILATLFGVGPIWAIVPVMMVGNASLVIIWHLIGNNKVLAGKDVAGICALIVAAVIKYALLFLGVTRVVLPLIGLADSNPAKAALLTTMFSLPQLATATIGGAFAIAILPILKKAIRNSGT